MIPVRGMTVEQCIASRGQDVIYAPEGACPERGQLRAVRGRYAFVAFDDNPGLAVAVDPADLVPAPAGENGAGRG